MEKMKVCKEIADKVQTVLGDNYLVTLQNNLKNNGVERCGLNIEKKEVERRITPTIYLEEYINVLGKEYEEIEIIDIANRIAEVYIELEKNEAEQFATIKNKMSKEQILNSVIYTLVNKEKNETLLEGVPSKDFLDLAVIYRSVVEVDDNGTANFLINNRMLEIFDITMEELDKAAEINTPKVHNFKIKKMSDVIKELNSLFLAEISGEEDEEEYDENEMHVVRGINGIFGASVMLFPENFKKLADSFESDLFVYPSSIHEVIAVSPKMVSLEGSREIVKYVNKDAVEAEEFLSDTVYKYNRETGKIEIAE